MIDSTQMIELDKRLSEHERAIERAMTAEFHMQTLSREIERVRVEMTSARQQVSSTRALLLACIEELSPTAILAEGPDGLYLEKEQTTSPMPNIGEPCNCAVAGVRECKRHGVLINEVAKRGTNT